MVPGQFPWYLDAEQAELLTAALQNLYMLCGYYMEGKLEVDFEARETLTRWYNPEKELWLNGVVPMPEPKLERSMTLQDDLLLARLKRSKKTGDRLEMDSFYFSDAGPGEQGDSPLWFIYVTCFVVFFDGPIL